MDTFDAIYQRRAVKHYDPEHVMPEEDLQKLLEAAIQAPTSFNIQHWRFVVVRDKELRRQIRAAGNDQAQITDASPSARLQEDVSNASLHVRGHAERLEVSRNSPLLGDVIE